MATTIKLKNGSGAPAASDLVQGEPAFDLTNKRLYTENGSGAVIEVGSNPSSLSINGTAVTATAAEINILDGVTSSTAELNILDGVTATAAELNYLDGVTSNIQTQLDTKGTGTVSSLSDLSVTASATELNLLDGVTATTAEINYLDGVTSNIQTQLDAAGGTVTLGDLGVTATAAELNTLDGITATTAELNILDGVTSTAAELNILDGVTATAAELNILDGVTAFVDEDDMSSDSATSIPSQQSVKAYVDSQVGSADTLAELTDTNVTTPADGALLFYDTTTSKWIDNVVSGDITIADTGVAAIGSGVIVNADVNASAAIDVSKTALAAGTGLTLTTNTLSVDAAQTQITSVGTLSSLSVSGTLTLGGTAITSTAAEINILDGVTATTAELNYVDGVTSNIQTQLDAKGTGSVSSLSDLGVTATAAELNLVDGSTADTVVNSKAVIYGAAGQITANELDVDNIQIDANAIKSTDTNGNIQLFPNGTGYTELYGNTNAGAIRFNCESNSHGVTLKGPPHSAAATYSLELPDADGTNGQALLTDGSGKLSFGSAGINTGKAIAMAIVFG